MDFLSKKEKQEKNNSLKPDVKWSEPVKEIKDKKTSKLGWFNFFKKANKSKNKEVNLISSHKEGFSVVKEHLVQEDVKKEIKPEKTVELKNVGTISKEKWPESAKEIKDKKTSKSGWFKFFKKTDKTKDKEVVISSSRKETLDLIKQYVKNKEDSKNGKSDLLDDIKKVPELNFSNSVQDRKAEDRTILPIGAPEGEKANVFNARSESDKKSWLKFVISKFKKAKKETETVVATDLIKGEVVTFFDRKKSITFFIVATLFSCLIIVAVNYALIYKTEIKRQDAKEYENKLSLINEKIATEEAGVKEIEKFQKKILLVNSLINNHTYWTRFFKFIEDNTLAEVSFSSQFNGTTEGEYTLNAKAKDFGAIVKQIEVLRNNSLVRAVSTTGGAVTRGDNEMVVSFDLKITLDPKVFLEKN